MNRKANWFLNITLKMQGRDVLKVFATKKKKKKMNNCD